MAAGALSLDGRFLAVQRSPTHIQVVHRLQPGLFVQVCWPRQLWVAWHCCHLWNRVGHRLGNPLDTRVGSRYAVQGPPASTGACAGWSFDLLPGPVPGQSCS